MLEIKKQMDWKIMFSSLLGFSTVVLLYSGAVPLFGFRRSPLPALFVATLVTQVLLEILSKYQGKLCETIEGLFTAMIAVLGLAMFEWIGRRGFTQQTIEVVGQPTVTTLGYSNVRDALIAGVIVATLLWVWKAWLKPKIFPNACGCDGPSTPWAQQPQQPEIVYVQEGDQDPTTVTTDQVAVVEQTEPPVAEGYNNFTSW